RRGRRAGGERGGGQKAGPAGAEASAPTPGRGRGQAVSSANGSDSSALAELVDRLASRLQAGERVDLRAVLADHPEHADELLRLLPALGALEDMSRSADA